MVAKVVVWTVRAQRDRKSILEYWLNRNKSNSYSIFLNRLFVDAEKTVRRFPDIGIKVGHDNIRYKVVKEYLFVAVLFIWDTRQNPLKFQSLIENQH